MELRELDQGTWPALERLFGPNGAVAGCWCTWFFQTGKELAGKGSDGNREILREAGLADAEIAALLEEGALIEPGS